MKSVAGEGTPDGGMLNSDVVQEMKAEISETRSQIQQLTEMMQQLLQAKPVGGGQQGEVSGCSGRRAAHNESNDTRRVPQQETAADARRGATTAAVGGSDQWSDRNSMTSERSRPAADYMGRRPEVPAGVGPITRMEHGEARNLYPAGIAVNGEEGVFVAGSSSGKLRVMPPVLKGRKGASRNSNMNSVSKQTCSTS